MVQYVLPAIPGSIGNCGFEIYGLNTPLVNNTLVNQISMKKIILCLIIFGVGRNSKAENGMMRTISSKVSIDTITYPVSSLSTVVWADYIHQPINTLLLYLDECFAGYMLSSVYSRDRLNIAAAINVLYGGGLCLIIYVNRFQHLNPVSYTGKWDVNLFRQENISAIELWDNVTCVFNSDP